MLVALFLPWYSVAGQDVTAWESMAVDDVILACAAALAILAALSVGLRRITSLSVATTSLVLLPAGIGLIVTVYRLLSPAPAADASIAIGGWLGLAAAVGMAAGAWEGATDEGPARRNPDAERRGTQEGVERSELLTLPAEGRGADSAPVQG
jgi:hypothetical protein